MTHPRIWFWHIFLALSCCTEEFAWNEVDSLDAIVVTLSHQWVAILINWMGLYDSYASSSSTRVMSLCGRPCMKRDYSEWKGEGEIKCAVLMIMITGCQIGVFFLAKWRWNWKPQDVICRQFRLRSWNGSIHL